MNRRPFVPFAVMLLVTAAALMTAGCRKKAATTTPTPPAPVERAPLPTEEVEREPIAEPTPREPEPEGEDLDETMRRQNQNREFLRTVYFDFDEYDLREDTIATLKSNAQWIKDNSQFKIVIEGHCDERGTIEYNLDLGAKRALAVLNYLRTLGVDVGRMRTISYGEERPVDFGHDESAWAKNRRADFTLEK